MKERQEDTAWWPNRGTHFQCHLTCRCFSACSSSFLCRVWLNSACERICSCVSCLCFSWTCQSFCSMSATSCVLEVCDMCVCVCVLCVFYVETKLFCLSCTTTGAFSHFLCCHDPSLGSTLRTAVPEVASWAQDPYKPWFVGSSATSWVVVVKLCPVTAATVPPQDFLERVVEREDERVFAWKCV